MRQDDSGIGQQAAPVAGMMSALAQIDHQVDRVAAAGTEIDRRLAGRDARAIRGDQQIGFQQLLLVPRTELRHAGGPHLLAHLDQHLGVEAEPAALGQDRGQRRDIDAVLALVVGGAAAVDAVALDRQGPGRKPRPPQIVETADGVAVAVEQDGDQLGIFDAFRHQERRSLAERVVENARRKVELGQARHHLVVEIAAQHAGALRLLAGARNGDPPRQIGDEFAAVEIGVRTRDRGGPIHAVTPSMLRA